MFSLLRSLNPLSMLLVLLLSGCTLFGVEQVTLFNDYQIYKVPLHETQKMSDVTAEENNYLSEVKPIIESRCVVCHACYDAACQLKMSSPAGISRGATKDNVYETSVFTRQPSRLFIDAKNTEQWRKQGFFPVINELSHSPADNIDASVIHKMLALKNNNPLPVDSNQRLPDKAFKFKLKDSLECPTVGSFPGYANNNPLGGMPYALPELNTKETTTLTEWLATGSKMKNVAQPALHQTVLDEWEKFLNGDSLKHQLVSRYIYEHLFTAHIHFDELPGKAYYKMVRSSTPPGEPINRIITRLPFQDPEIDRVYYRLWYDPATVVVKNHLPYAFNTARMEWLQTLFFDEPYEVTKKPDYKHDVASNPFVAFKEIPSRLRYRFMLEESRHTIMGFIKGPVCRGQVALNVIQDHFWVVFVDPENQTTPMLDDFLMQQSHNLQLPGSEGGYSSLVGSWSAYSEMSDEYLASRLSLIEARRPEGEPLTLDYIWDGDGNNKNAALTIFRHFDSATVVHGLVGQQPKTAWLINYPLLERIHYLLVAEFDVFGNLGHQLSTRLYMDFLRQEGEVSFLNLLPRDQRSKIQKFWYREPNEAIQHYLERCETNFGISTGLELRSEEPQRELYQLLQAHLSPVLESKYDIFNSKLPREHRRLLTELEKLSGYYTRYFPEMAILSIEEPDGKIYLYTVIRNLAHSNISSLFSENDNRLEDEDYLTVVRGIVGDYPNTFWHVNSADLDDFVTGIGNITSEEDYGNIMRHFGIRRSHKDFWSHSDKVHATLNGMEPIEGGILDYNRLENR